MKKKFVLGVGAQKAGTTWLHDYLSNLPRSDFGFTKEYHVFDTISLPEFSSAREMREEYAAKNPKDKAVENKRKVIISKKLLPFFDNPELYFDYFASILGKSDISLTGDITPSYAGLTEETLNYIKKSIEKRGIHIKPIFLMRDPVLRLQSMIRMKLKRNGIKPSLEEEIAAMQKKHCSPQDLIRSSYHNTVRRLDKVFGENVFYGFYESLFQEDTIKNLCSFIEVDYQAPKLDVRKNVSQTSNDLNDAQRAEFRKGYEEIYSFCRSRFGKEKIDALWGE